MLRRVFILELLIMVFHGRMPIVTSKRGSDAALNIKMDIFACI